jgi:hypothetical protein
MTLEKKPFEELSKSGKWSRENPEYNKEYFKNTDYIRNHRENINRRRRELRKQHRIIVLMHYSNGTMACRVCGENNVNFLTIDHINNGGNQHLRETSTTITEWLFYMHRRAGKWPKGFQVLCANHNLEKELDRREADEH